MSTVDVSTAPATTAPEDVLRVTVTARSRTADLTLPALLPLAEVLPGVVRTLGALEAEEVHGGYRIHTADGQALDPDLSLGAQGVQHGAVLSISAGVDDPPTKVYDDVVEAVADVVEEQAGGWTPQSSRHTMLAVAAVLSVLGAWTLHTADVAPLTATWVAGAIAVLTTLAGAVLAKVREDAGGALVLLGVAIVFVAVAATSGVLEEPGAAGVAAGLGAAVVGAVGLAALRQRGWPLLPAVTVGAVGAAVGALVGVTGLDLGRVLLVVVVLLVLAAGVMPRYALQLTRTAPPPLQSEAEVLADPEPIDPAGVRGRVDVSAGLVHGLLLTVVTLHVLAAPVIAAQGPFALVVSVIVSALLALGARRAARAVDIVISVAGGVLSFATAVVGAVLAEPAWAPVLGVAVGAVAAGTVIALAFPVRSELVSARALDVVESVLLVAVVPLTVLALDVIPFP